MARVLVLDSGAVIGLTRGNELIRTIVAAANRQKAVVVPAVVIAETTRGEGARDAPANRLINRAEVVATDESIARHAGALLASAGSAATIDAIVVATAATKEDAFVLTTDPDDLAPLAALLPNVAITRL